MSETLDCPECGHNQSKVKNSRAAALIQAVRRRRECASCGHRFSTLERFIGDERTDIAINARWQVGDYVMKRKNSAWRGRVVGFYRTKATPLGYCIESSFEVGSVQIWPEVALMPWHPPHNILLRDRRSDAND